jgi:hypothetical protein
MPIGRHSFWCVTHHVSSLLEKALGRLQISFLTQHRINQIAIAIDGSIELAPFPFHADIRFIDVPRFSCLSVSLGSQLVAYERGKTLFPRAFLSHA